MKGKSPLLPIALTVAVFAAVNTAACSTTVGHDLHKTANDTAHASKDTYITSKIKAQYLTAKGLDSDNVHVTTDRGVVTLRGTVPSETQEHQAVEIARKTDGVKSVENYLQAATKQ